MNILLISGNKRSGSTHLMRLLNYHPNIYVTNESDMLWVNYQFHNGFMGNFIQYHNDGRKGMDKALSIGRKALEEGNTVEESLLRFQKPFSNMKIKVAIKLGKISFISEIKNRIKTLTRN